MAAVPDSRFERPEVESLTKVGENPKVNARIDVVKLLGTLFPDQIFSRDSQIYSAESCAQWSKASWLMPLCVFLPKSTEELARGIAVFAKHNLPFAVRSGGHMPAKGHASINSEGVLIATSLLNDIQLVESSDISVDASYLSIGPGNTWGQVYEFLAPHDLLVLGGRVTSVGSGLILGGGISFFGSNYGFAANHVVNFHIALADGSLMNANKYENPDLFWALKGGSNNFGIVVRYDLRVFKENVLWGGALMWSPADTVKILEAQTQYMLPGGGVDDPRAGIMSHFEVEASGNVTCGAMLLHDGGNCTPFAPFLKVPATLSTVGIQKFTAIVAPTEVYGARNRRVNFSSVSMFIAEDTMQLVYNAVTTAHRELLRGISCSVGAGVQPITTSFREAAKAAGGDPMDLDPQQGNFAVILLYAYWDHASDDDSIGLWSSRVVDQIETESRSKGLYHPFKYLNDSSVEQKPFQSYGNGRSLARLREISRKYDPTQVFQRLVPGFKLLGED